MDAIQTDVSREALINAIRANMCDFFRHTSRSNPAGHFENEHFTRWYTPFPHPWLNGVLSSTPPINGARSFIAETIRYFHEKAAGTFTWWMAPHLNPSDWKSALSQHNFGFSSTTPGIAIDLLDFNQSLLKVKGLEVRLVNDEASLRDWVKVFTRGCGFLPDWEKVAFDLWLKLGLSYPMCNYLGYFNGEPVSTSSLFLGGGVAGIYCLTTLPSMRGRGFGSALTVKPLLDARAIGYRIGVLHSAGLEYNVYKKVGGQHLCQIENYYLTIL